MVNKCDLEEYSGQPKSSVIVDGEQCYTQMNMRYHNTDPIRISTPIDANFDLAILSSVELYAGCHGNRMSIVSP